MDHERWNRLKTTFHKAVSLREKERKEFLQRTCSDDASLLAEIEQLLAQADTMPEEYLEPPGIR